jgi:hypothetical protein
MRTLTVMLAIVHLGLANIAAAQSGLSHNADNRPVAVDPQGVFADLRETYSTHAIRERIVMTVRDGDARLLEDIHFTTRRIDGFAEPEIELGLGEYTFWTRPPEAGVSGAGVIRVQHQLNASSYVQLECAAASSTFDCVRESLPPVILPQLGLALDAPSAELVPPFGQLNWSDARVVPGDERLGIAPYVRLLAMSDRMRVVVEAVTDETLDTLVIRRVEAEALGRPLRITLDVEQRGSLTRRVGVEVAHLTRLDSLESLVPRLGDVVAGVEMPEIPAEFWTVDERAPLADWHARLVVVFWGGDVTDELTPATAIGLNAARTAAKRLRGDVRIEPMAVFDPVRITGERDVQGLVMDLYQAVEPEILYYSISERRSLRRFTAEGSAALVVVDSGNVVREVIDLDELAQRVDMGDFGAREAAMEAAGRAVSVLRNAPNSP